MKWLVDEAYRDAKTVRVVMDNLNTCMLHEPLRWPICGVDERGSSSNTG